MQRAASDGTQAVQIYQALSRLTRRDTIFSAVRPSSRKRRQRDRDATASCPTRNRVKLEMDPRTIAALLTAAGQ
jgi:hypothetical protein